jgi:hypothetical protein
MFRVAKRGGLVLVLGEPCVSGLHKFVRPAVRAFRRLRSAGRGVLDKLPDENFQFTWRDFDRVFRPLSGEFEIERAHGSTSVRQTPEGLVFVEDHRPLLPFVRLMDQVVPGNLGYWGDLNVRARKTRSVQRKRECPAYEPVDPGEVYVEEITEEKRKSYLEVFDRIMDGWDR